VCPHCHALLWPAEKSRTTMCCCSGKNLNLQSIFSTAFPPLLHDLFTWDVTTNQTSPTNLTPRVIRNFRKHIRQYNCALQMASSGMKIAAPNQGISIIVAKGSVYHLMGPLIPNQGVPQFAQLYIIDNDSEQVHQRLRNFVNNNMNRELLQRLQECLLQCNPFVQQFRQTIQDIQSTDMSLDEREIYISTDGHVDHRRYNAPTGYGQQEVVLHRNVWSGLSSQNHPNT
jgi:hypothetical protein